MAMKTPMPQVVVDTREQNPWEFENSVRIGIPTGDYSLVGMEHIVAVERKSLPDLVMSLTHERERFMREIDRLAELERRAVIVEASLADIAGKLYYGAATPNSLITSCLAISTERNVPIVFAGNRYLAKWCCEWLLKRAWQKSTSPQETPTLKD